jgi:hypothetical protein
MKERKNERKRKIKKERNCFTSNLSAPILKMQSYPHDA